MHKTLTCLSLAALLGACGTPDNGYYDAHGNFVPYNRYKAENHSRPPIPGGTHDPRDDAAYEETRPVAYTTTTTTYHYDRPGYYDRTGYYTAMNGGLRAPDNMLPPRGMCRVWFPERTPSDQPPVEVCDNVSMRIPADAYVIYGG